jgi:Glycosyl transferase family 2
MEARRPTREHPSELCPHRIGTSAAPAAGRAGLAHADGEYVLFLDDDAELEPGALDLLVNELDAHPQVVGVTCTVVLPNGTVQHSGGWLRDSGDMAEFGLVASGSPTRTSRTTSGVIAWSEPGPVASGAHVKRVSSTIRSSTASRRSAT